jgi:hypothetical protein
MLRSNDDPQRLIPGAPEAFVVSAHYVVGEGWDCKISVRRQFQLWAGASEGRYTHMTTAECFEVVEAALATELEL